MEQQLSSNDKIKPISPINPSTQRSSVQNTDRCDTATSSSRIISPIAFFRDSVTTNETELHNNSMSAQRRAQAIATAPRRRRHDVDKDDEDNGQKKSLFDFIKTSSLPISIQIDSQRSHSLPQTQSHIDLLPTFRIDPSTQNISEPLNYKSNYKSHHHYLSASLPSRNENSKN